MAVQQDRAVLHWWRFDLPRSNERTFRRYLARNPQYRSKNAQNAIPFPELVTADMGRWWNPKREQWVIYNTQPQGLVTALDRGWLPEAPANAVVESGETAEGDHGESGLQDETVQLLTCDVCGKVGFATPAGMKSHKTMKHKEE